MGNINALVTVNKRRADAERDPQTYAIIGAAMTVHGEFQNGFLEAVYHEALAIEFAAHQIPFKHEVDLPIKYKGFTLQTIYRADYVCYEDIILEIKAVERLTEIHQAQLIHYLKATGFRRGLLINFGTPSLQFQRIVYGEPIASPTIR
jgi:GxxExxY protein